MRILLLLGVSVLPLSLYAHTNGLPIRETGAPADGPSTQTCAQCHTGGTTGPGHLNVYVQQYAPGSSQAMTVQIDSDLTGQDFGFQLTARLASDETQQAGYFQPTPDSQIYCAPDAKPGPCHGAVEFVTHTAASIQPSAAGRRTWQLTWVPPGRDLGPVHFYVAAVAGAPGGPAGDRVYIQNALVNPAGCNLSGAPTIGSGGGAPITDAASFSATISSNGLMSIFGTGFSIPGGPVPGNPGAGYSATKADLVSSNWPTDLACVGVAVDGVRVPVFFVTEHQINAQAPRFSSGELAKVQVVLNPDSPKAITSNLATVNAALVAPSLFTFSGSGAGNVAALDATKGNKFLADTSVVASGVSAKPGDTILLYGTGFGDTNPLFNPGVFATGLTTLVNPISISIGGVTLSTTVCGSCDIQYAGLAFDAPGFYQVNLHVPQVPDGDQHITVTVGAARSQNGATIPVKNQ